MPENPILRLDEFIAKVVSDPSQPQETLLLQGFLGASSEPDHTRIYTDVTLGSYVDVANADIVHSEPLPKEQSPLGGAYIWVKKSADAYPESSPMPGDTRAKAKFLEGPIAAEASDFSASAGVKPVPALPKTVPILACHPTLLVRACLLPTINSCPTQFLTCHPTLFCPTNPRVCIERTGPGCFIPDPTIYEQQGEQFGAKAAGVAQPQIATALPACHVKLPPSLVYDCPTVNYYLCHHTSFIQCRPTAICPVPTVYCPPHISLACGYTEQTVQQVEFAAQAQPAGPVQALPASVAVPHCPVTVATCPSLARAACISVAAAVCPTAQCPTPLHHCPSVSGYDCPSVSGYQCASVHGYHCPSVASYQCPTINNYHCPKTAICTEVGVGCMYTPNPQHCPTPNMICQRPTIACVSVQDVCPTSSPLFCE